MEWQNVVAGQRADPEQINKIGNQVAKYKGLRLARRVVLTEAVSSITFDTDDDGNALNSTLGGELVFYSGTNASISIFTNLQMQLNNISEGEYWTSHSTTATSLLAGRCAAVLSEGRILINNLNQNLIFNSSCVYRYSTAGNLLTSGGGMTTPQTSVTAIKLFLASGTFPAGTVAEWWERG